MKIPQAFLLETQNLQYLFFHGRVWIDITDFQYLIWKGYKNSSLNYKLHVYYTKSLFKKNAFNLEIFSKLILPIATCNWTFLKQVKKKGGGMKFLNASNVIWYIIDRLILY